MSDTGQSVRERFYDTVDIRQEEEGFTILLDGRPVRTPMGAPLISKTEKLAQAVKTEWESQGETLDPASMPMTQLLNTALDRMEAAREEVIDALVKYARDELLCYRAESPDTLVAREGEQWDPELEWVRDELDLDFDICTGIVPGAASEDNQRRVRDRLETLSAEELAGASLVIAATGSIVLGLAVLEERHDAATVFRLSQLEEDFQIEQWGEDSEAAIRRAAIRQEIEAAARFIALARAR